MIPSWHDLNQSIVGCEKCPRLRAYCLEVAQLKRRAFMDWQYWGLPVPNFGDDTAKLLIVGLAPAAHGANRTGRMFTGDRSGEWLYRALHRAGLANQAEATAAEDGLQLNGCAITAVCHCAPPQNKPSREELAACHEWLESTFDLLPVKVIVALGGIAFDAVCQEIRRRGWLTGSKRPKFGHGVRTTLSEGRWLLGSYHPSQQNTFTGRLSEAMLDSIFADAVSLLNQG